MNAFGAAEGLLASLVLEDGRRWGDAAVPHQVADARAVLDVDGPRRHWLGRSRGYSKTSDTAGMSAAVMLTQLAAGSTAYAAAADKDQARLLADKIRGYAVRTPELRGALTVQSYRVVAERTGVVLEILAADAASAYGLTPALLVVDELCQWPSTANAKEFYSALTSALPKVPDSRLVIMTTAGDPAHFSHKIYKQAVRSRRWRVSEVHGPAPWQDPQDLEEQRAALMPSTYERLFENRWTASEDKLVDVSDLDAAMTVPTPVPPVRGVEYVAGLDVGLKNDRTVLVVAHAEAGGDRVEVDVLQRWRGTRENPVQLADIEAAVADVHDRYRPRVLVDPWQASGLVQRLEGRGVDITEFPFTSQSVGRVAHALYSLLRSRRIGLPADDEVLRDELLNVRVRETQPGAFRLDHDSGKHDDQAVAIGLVAQELVNLGGGARFHFPPSFEEQVAAVDPAATDPTRPPEPLPGVEYFGGFPALNGDGSVPGWQGFGGWGRVY